MAFTARSSYGRPRGNRARKGVTTDRGLTSAPTPGGARSGEPDGRPPRGPSLTGGRGGGPTVEPASDRPRATRIWTSPGAPQPRRAPGRGRSRDLWAMREPAGSEGEGPGAPSQTEADLAA